MADTIKYLSDFSARSTVIIVGVGNTVDELFGGHPSIQRNVQPIKMPRMEPHELRDIFDKRMPILGMTIDDRVLDSIVRLSQGLPSYTHLLGQNAAKAAIRRRSLKIESIDLSNAVHVCVDEATVTVKDAYTKAVRSSRPTNQYRKALLACALAGANDDGFFTAMSVREPYSRLEGRDRDIPYFSRYLEKFCEDERGPALVKIGKPKSYEYRFVDPLLRPYSIICGIADGLINP
jgi:hypothetical protein